MYSVLRFGKPKLSDFIDQQLCPHGTHYCGTVQVSLAGGTVFQVDQATPQDQGFLWYFQECGEDSDMDSYISLCTCCYRQKDATFRYKSLHNFTDFECDCIRENPYFTSIYRIQLQRAEG